MDRFPFHFYLLVFFYCFLTCKSTFTNDDDHFGGIMNLLELDTVKYEIEILPIPVMEEETLKRESSLVLMSKHGQKYECQLPSDAAMDWSMEEGDSDDSTPYTDIPELLKPLKSKCLVANEGWWNYKYCHGNGVTQFHMEGGRIVGDIVYLGYYDNEIAWTKEKLRKAFNHRIKNHSGDRNIMKLPSHDVHYVNGTKCELTGLPRSVNARLTCSPFHTSSEIVRIIEQKSCNYSLLIHTPHLCDHPLFIPDSKLGLSVIQCSPIFSQHKYNRFMQSLENKKSASVETTPDEASLLLEPPQDKPTTDTVPLMNVLETLADSIAKELSVDTNGAKDSISEDEDEISPELEDAIENLVTESLNKVFGISDTDEKEKQPNKQSDPHTSYPKGPKSKVSSQRGLQSDHTAVAASKEQATTKSAKEEGGFAKKVIIKTISLDGKQSQDGKSNTEEGRKGRKEEPSSHSTTKEQHKHSTTHSTGNSKTDSNDGQSSNAASVLVSMLQDILKEGILEYPGDTTTNMKDEQRSEMKQRQLEERYETGWKETDEED